MKALFERCFQVFNMLMCDVTVMVQNLSDYWRMCVAFSHLPDKFSLINDICAGLKMPIVDVSSETTEIM